MTTAFATTDLCDAHEDRLRDGRVQVPQPPWISLGKVPRFCGRVVTLRVPEDNSLVRTALEQPGEGRVLVIDGGASLRCALVGGNLAALGERNGWAGAIVNGCVVLAFAGVVVRPGDWIAADRDGWIVATEPLIA
jgi:regulator of ribonuclease activity A